MNNFNLLLIDWDHLIVKFETDELSQHLKELEDSGNPDQKSNAASLFLNSHLERGSTIDDRTIAPFNPMVGASWIWDEFGETYSQMRTLLPNDLMAIFDALYLPFLAPWVSGVCVRRFMFQLPDEMRRLSAGGLSLAISPKRCKELDAFARIYTFSYFIHSIACHKKESFPLRRNGSWFNPCAVSQDSSANTIHASYTEFAELLRALVIRAARLNKGIIGVVEV